LSPGRFAGGRSALAFHREIIRPGIRRTSFDQAGVRRQSLEDATDPGEKNLPGASQRPDDFADRTRKTTNVNSLKTRSNPATCFFIVQLAHYLLLEQQGDLVE
jgi:hypothetical protein